MGPLDPAALVEDLYAPATVIEADLQVLVDEERARAVTYQCSPFDHIKAYDVPEAEREAIRVRERERLEPLPEDWSY